MQVAAVLLLIFIHSSLWPLHEKCVHEHVHTCICVQVHTYIHRHTIHTSAHTHTHTHTSVTLCDSLRWREDKKTQPGLPPLACGGEDAPHLPFPLFHRRPISTQPLTHLSRMANGAPVYSPQQRNTEGKEG